MSLSEVGASTPFITNTGTRKVSGTAPLDATGGATKTDPMAFLAAGKSLIRKSKDRDFQSNFFSALQSLKQQNIEGGRGHISIKADDGNGQPMKLDAKIKVTDKGLQIKGSIKGVDGLPNMQFRVAVKGHLSKGGVQIDAQAHGGGMRCHCKGTITV